VIAETVATPLEEAINGVEGMLYMGSQATTDGLMTLTVTFKLGTDPDKAQQLVQNRVVQAEPRLPEEVRRLGVTTIKSSPDLTMVVHLLSPSGRYDMTYLRNYALLNVKDRLARVKGVGDVQLFGSGDYSMRSGSTRTRSRSVVCRPPTWSPRSASRTCRRQPAWSARRPASPVSTCSSRSMRKGRLQNEEEFGDIIVKTGSDGAVTRLRDIAASSSAHRVIRCARCSTTRTRWRCRSSPPGLERDPDLRRRARHDGRDQAAHARGRGLRDRLRPDPVRARLDRVGGAHAARSGGAGRARRHPVPADLAASVIPLLAVPVSVIGTFAVMHLFGFSINALSLFGLVLAIGIVVDDAIVVVENVERNIEAGFDATRGHLPRDARSLGADHRDRADADRGVRAARFHQRPHGQFYRQFALTIAMSTVISAINSLTLSPRSPRCCSSRTTRPRTR
jgi:multidrug efflux pump